MDKMRVLTNNIIPETSIKSVVMMFDANEGWPDTPAILRVQYIHGARFFPSDK